MRALLNPLKPPRTSRARPVPSRRERKKIRTISVSVLTLERMSSRVVALVARAKKTRGWRCAQTLRDTDPAPRETTSIRASRDER
jgi:hypothetical protein